MQTPGERYFLYAEDDPDDQKLFQEIVADIDQGIDVVLCHHGLELVHFLEGLPSGAPLPCCIVLDMNMPLWDGARTLQTLKAHPRFQHLTVVMFTTSSALRDAHKSLEQGAAAFLTKPVTKEDFLVVAGEFSLLCSDQAAKFVTE